MPSCTSTLAPTTTDLPADPAHRQGTPAGGPESQSVHDPVQTPTICCRRGEEYRPAAASPHRQLPDPRDTFDLRGFGIVSCYNALPQAGGANTLVRISLKRVAEQAAGIDDFLGCLLPHYCRLTSQLIAVRRLPARGVRFLRQLPGGGGCWMRIASSPCSASLAWRRR